MKSTLFVLFAATAACVSTRSPGLLVETESSAAASFAAYRTFGFGPAEAPPAPFQVSARSFEVERRMRALISAELVRKGYAEQPGPGHPDFVIGFASGYAREPPFGGEAPLFEMPEKGAIVIDAFDASSAAQVWHGAGQAQVDPEKVDDPLLQTSVERVLASFPARSTNGLSSVASSRLDEDSVARPADTAARVVQHDP